MAKDLLDLTVRSLWLWTVTGAALWAVIGGLVASWQGVRVLPAAAASAVAPVVGAAAVLLWAARRPVGARFADPVAVLEASPARGPWSAELVEADDWSPPVDEGRSSAPAAGAGSAVLVAAAAWSAAVLLCLALELPWFSVRPVDVILGEYVGASTIVTGVPLLACIGVLLACGVLQALRPRRLWSLLALLCSAPWIVVGGQVLLAAGDFSRVLGRLAGRARVGTRVDVIAGPGAYVLVAAGLVGFTWATWAAWATHRLSRSDNWRGTGNG
jgi:hypothetical protein